MIRTVFKITHNDDSIYYTTDRKDVVDNINNYHIDNTEFKKYTMGTINGVLYNKNKKVRGVKDVEAFNVRDFYKEYIDVYTSKINRLPDAQRYSPLSIKRLQNNFITFINAEIIEMKNNNNTDEEIKEHIYKFARL